MAYFASVNGLPIVAGTLLIPAVGAWTADLHLAGGTAVTGVATVVIGNLTLSGTIFRSSVYGGQTRARIVAGAGGWRTSIPSQGYGSSAGVRLSTVLQDAAAACGETVAIPADTILGTAFVRTAFASGVASDVLWQLVSQGVLPGWYVDATGTTQPTTWPSSTITSTFTVTDQKPDEGVAVVATEDYASWMPGAQFTAPQISGTLVSAGVHYVWTDDGKFRFEVLTGVSGDRVLGPIQQLVQKELQPARFYGRYEYTVSNPSATTVDAEPTDPALGLPDLQSVPLTADALASYTPAANATCHIMFVNGLPTKPVCVWTDQTPTKAQILSGGQPVARLGDQVQSFLPPGLPVVGTVSGNPFVGTITVANPITGTITGGSSQVSTA
jgi:hypothetical protein